MKFRLPQNCLRHPDPTARTNPEVELHRDRNQAQGGRRFSLSPGERVGVRGNLVSRSFHESRVLCLGLALLCALNAATGADIPPPFEDSTQIVGRFAGGLETPVNQRLTPAGKLVELPGMRPNALALSPNAEILVTAGLTHELVVLDPVTGSVLQKVPFPSDKSPEQSPVSPLILQPGEQAQLSYTGLAFSPDGTRFYLANVNGDIKVFAVDQQHKVSALYSLALPAAAAPWRKAEIPAGIAVSADNKRLYVALNLSNRLVELYATNGQVLRTWAVGVAPFAVALARNKAYVSNWGGRRPDTTSLAGPAGRGTFVRVDTRGIASEGSVSVVDLRSRTLSNEEQEVKTELVTGLHACALAVSPDAHYVVVANAGSDTVSVIDTRADKIVDTLCARQQPSDLFGAQPNALAFDHAGKRLFVCNGTQNAVAVFQFETSARLLGLFPTSGFKPGRSKLLGLIPVGWFPGAIAYDARHKILCVANIKHISPGRPQKNNGRTEFNTRQFYGSLSLVPEPSPGDLESFTKTALANLRYPLLAEAALPPRAEAAPRPVPERTGEPSVFRHVLYIIKENRTYDQVLGDIKAGNGDAGLCVFGERVTPNQHKLTRDFVLLDNTYCCGILSADGHQWANGAMATDYMERSLAGFPRSYPAGNNTNEQDALAYSPAGFIWNNALSHGKTVRDYGEFTLSHKRWRDPARKGEPKFLDCYRDFIRGGTNIVLWSEPGVEPLRACLATNTVGWDLDVPDVWRADKFITDLKQLEQTGALANLTILWLPNDHTSGTRPGGPTPAAQVADNDLAFGRVVEAISHSKFWKDTCIFAIEDDPQAGWDHVSGYRTTAYVASPYTRRGQVIHTQYNHLSLLRTMELMLGLPPMNQMDATARPMSDCFMPAPDLTPFDTVTNNIPLDQVNSPVKSVASALRRKDAELSARLPLDQPDQCPDDLLNRILWRAMRGTDSPYPQWAVRAEEEE
jgi:YVTN family beta-propeller protein